MQSITKILLLFVSSIIFTHFSNLGPLHKFVLVLLPKIISFLIVRCQISFALMLFGKIEFLVIWRLEKLNNLHDYLENLKAFLPMLFGHIFEHDSIALVAIFWLTNIDMEYWLFEVTLQWCLWILIGYVNVELKGLPLICTVLGRIDQNRNLLDVFEIVKHDFVEAFEDALVVFQGESAALRAPAYVSAGTIIVQIYRRHVRICLYFLLFLYAPFTYLFLVKLLNQKHGLCVLMVAKQMGDEFHESKFNLKPHCCRLTETWFGQKSCIYLFIGIGLAQPFGIALEQIGQIAHGVVVIVWHFV